MDPPQFLQMQRGVLILWVEQECGMCFDSIQSVLHRNIGSPQEFSQFLTMERDYILLCIMHTHGFVYITRGIIIPMVRNHYARV